jgi:hypothetical protein
VNSLTFATLIMSDYYFLWEQLYGSAQPSGRRSERWLANAVARRERTNRRAKFQPSRSRS